MKDNPALNRRQLLRAAIAASAAPLFPSLLPPMADSQPIPAPPAHKQALAVVFHGLFAFLLGVDRKPITVVIPNVSGHRYWAGDFGHEDLNVLPKKTSTLTGVDNGTWDSSKIDFPFLPDPVKIKDTSKRYATVIVPWPDDLLTDRHVPPQTGADFFSQPPRLKPPTFPMIYTFMYYDVTITARPALTNTNWKAPRTWGEPGGATTAVLHIRAEHCGYSDDNGWDVFNSLFGLTGASAIKLNEPVYGSGKPGAGYGVPGVVPPEQDDFLTEEPGCQKHGVGIVSRPVNCAGIGGKTAP